MAKLSAFSILESTLAMALISIVFSIGWMVVESVLNNNRQVFEYRVHQAMDQCAQVTKTKQLFLNEIIDSLDFSIHKTILPTAFGEDVYLLSLEAFDRDNQRVATQKELIRVQ